MGSSGLRRETDRRVHRRQLRAANQAQWRVDEPPALPVGPQGRHLADLSAVERHKLRIKIKTIRYAVDFFRSLYPAQAQAGIERLSGQLKKIQDALGALNDFIVHREIVVDAALHAPRGDRRAQAFAPDLLVGQERGASKTLLKAASNAMRHLRPRSVELD